MKNWRFIILIAGITLVIGGFVLTILGKLLGILAVLIGFGLIFSYTFMMMRGAGYHPTSACLADGDPFPGRQQSQVAREKAQPVMDEKPVNIWDQMEQKQK